MKSIKVVTIVSGVLVVLAVIVSQHLERTSKKLTVQLTSPSVAMPRLFTSTGCSGCHSGNELVESILREDHSGQLYVLALAALIGLSAEKTSRKQAIPEKSPGFAVVELFTSEGCDTCPPADELVANIQREDKTGKIYILAYHVDYWDHQGWKDKFSEKEYTDRQIQYGFWLNVYSIYTPQIVVNGTTEHVGSDKRSVLGAISAGLAQETTKELTLNAWLEGDLIHVEYQSVVDEKNSVLVLALIQKSAHVDVKGGENIGRSLSHVQIVRRMSRVLLDANTKKVTSIKPPVEFTGKGWEIIGFVQRKSNGRITAVGRFDFDSEASLQMSK